MKYNIWTHIRRSPYQSMAAMLTMFLTMLLGGIFFVTTAASVMVLGYFESKPQITVFFSDTATPEDATKLQKTLTATGKVASTKYISKDSALAIYREQNKSDPLLLELVTADILPASLEVSATDPTYLEEFEPVIKQSQGVEEVVYQKDVIKTLLAWTNAIRIVGGGLAGLLAVDAILIVMTVIGMKIALKKEEIDILKLVGASPWYIRRPFILEGGLYGAVGAFASWGVIEGILAWFQPTIFGFLGMIPQVGYIFGSLTTAPFYIASAIFMAAMLAIGFLLGSLGSWVALSRYLVF